ncbi:MAG: MAPEG family protein [Pseudomonadota bacterium]
MNVVPVYAALLALMFVALSVRTLMLRRSLGIAIGDGDNTRMLRATRVHANFAEYVPLTLLLLFLAESRGLAESAVHMLCVCLTAGRMIHAWGVSQEAEAFLFRVSGMALTFTSLIGVAVALLRQSFSAI